MNDFYKLLHRHPQLPKKISVTCKDLYNKESMRKNNCRKRISPTYKKSGYFKDWSRTGKKKIYLLHTFVYYGDRCERLYRILWIGVSRSNVFSKRNKTPIKSSNLSSSHYDTSSFTFTFTSTLTICLHNKV